VPGYNKDKETPSVKKSTLKADSNSIDDAHFGRIEIGKPLELENIYFDFDKYDLLPQSFEELDLLYDLIERNPQYNIKIEGHTDSLGTNEYNFLLSDNRAKSVRDFLISKGCKIDRISWKGHGSTKPVDTNETEDGRQNNRRVEFTLLYQEH